MTKGTILSPDELTALDAPNGFSRSAAQRLVAKIKCVDSGCWEFIGARRHGGYGHITRGPKGGGNEAAHRLVWMLVHGQIPSGLAVLHHCDNPPCCNPAHLWLGTQRDNVEDMLGKGRHGGPQGEQHPSATLTDQDVAELRTLASTIPNHAELGRRFGISKQHARSIVLRHKRTAQG